MKVWRVALATALLQIAISVGVMMAVSTLFGWSLPLAVVLGFAAALSSTAVVIKMLEQINVLRAPVGQLVIGILIAQDLAVVPMILTLNAIAEPAISVLHILKIVASITFLVLLAIWLSRRKRLNLPFGKIVAGQFDLRPLAGLTTCFAAAAMTGLLGLSAPFGAFLAGLIIGNSNARSMMIRSTQPIQSVLLMVFFLSIGLLIDLRFVWDNLGVVLALLLLVTVLKTALNIGLLHLLREPWPHAFVAGVVLAQIGEFSFRARSNRDRRRADRPAGDAPNRRSDRLLALGLAALDGGGAAAHAHHPAVGDLLRRDGRAPDRRQDTARPA